MRALPRVMRGGPSIVMVAVSSVVGIYAFGAASVSAAPVDTTLPIPVAGIHISALAYWPTSRMDVVASTDTMSPGITTFSGSNSAISNTGCACFVHWRNVSTGAGGTTDVAGNNPVSVVTGSGLVVAGATFHSAGFPGIDVTVIPGAGTWTVP
ncbi:hypothetical protein [Rhodococcus opacus]|uniref:Uncharacterized protein n=1 Tax=Rhodococcus opacus (strain B4) TaxID=632772 RepID=C1AXB1_RHOOB|nr:hypothetical protein [Rhodococcus opacus]BAH49615.1 hypothetical protein ROP_13680 [Rhodococcus opacus B4]